MPKVMTKEQALRTAQKLVKELGPGWKPWVWENCGWHFEARLDDGTPFGRLRVFGEEGSWHALLNTDGESPSGHMSWAPPWGPDPVAVARAAVALARAEADSTYELLELLPAAFGGRKK